MLARWIKLCFLLLLAGITACGSATPTPRTVYITTTPGPKSPTPRVAVVTAVPSTSGAESSATDTPTPTLLPTETTAVSTRTPVPSATASQATSLPPTPGNAAPGVYVTALSVQPANPIRGAPMTFVATFVNTTGSPQPFDWLVLIYRAGQRNSFGETSGTFVTIPTGMSQSPSAGNWRITRGAGCEPFSAQANWQTFPEKVRTPFTSTDGQIVTLNFTICSS